MLIVIAPNHHQGKSWLERNNIFGQHTIVTPTAWNHIRGTKAHSVALVTYDMYLTPEASFHIVASLQHLLTQDYENAVQGVFAVTSGGGRRAVQAYAARLRRKAKKQMRKWRATETIGKAIHHSSVETMLRKGRKKA